MGRRSSLALHIGVVGDWVALNVLMGVRLITCGARFVGRRWAVTGAVHEHLDETLTFAG